MSHSSHRSTHAQHVRTQKAKKPGKYHKPHLALKGRASKDAQRRR